MRIYDALFDAEPYSLCDAALSYLGPEIELTRAVDNAEAPLGYGETKIPNCWRFYFQLKDAATLAVGGQQHYILIEKNTGSVLGTGIEIGE